MAVTCLEQKGNKAGIATHSMAAIELRRLGQMALFLIQADLVEQQAADSVEGLAIIHRRQMITRAIVIEEIPEQAQDIEVFFEQALDAGLEQLEDTLAEGGRWGRVSLGNVPPSGSCSCLSRLARKEWLNKGHNDSDAAFGERLRSQLNSGFAPRAQGPVEQRHDLSGGQARGHGLKSLQAFAEGGLEAVVAGDHLAELVQGRGMAKQFDDALTRRSSGR